MKTAILSLIFLLLFDFYSCNAIKQLFKEINQKTVTFNAIAADIAWEYSVEPDQPGLVRKAASYQKKQTEWHQKTCDELTKLMTGTSFNSSQHRQMFLLCSGPKFTYEESRIASSLLKEIQSIYSNAQICIPSKKYVTIDNPEEVEEVILYYLRFVSNLKLKTKRNLFAVKLAANEHVYKNETICLNGEEDMDKLMKFSRDEEVLKWLWMVWREKVGPPMRGPYKELVVLENRAAQRNGYPDIGRSWREEYEIDNLGKLCRDLYEDIEPLYSLLHGVVRFFLRKQYGEVVPARGPIPAHLLGDLWSQNWEPLTDLIVRKTINLDESIKNLNWTVFHMVKRAEDFYMSLGLPAMTDKFWQRSAFAPTNNSTRCHGTAADMFQDGDFRILYCSGTSFEDFYVLHHEMGHIQYYMAYEDKPGLFRQANSALHETIGDTIMIGVMTPQHLHRLGLINDSILFSSQAPQETRINKVLLDADMNPGLHDEHEDIPLSYIRSRSIEVNRLKSKDVRVDDLIKLSTDEIILLKQALNKLPQIPFALLIDEFRWNYFAGKISDASLNENFWDMALELQGIAPPEKRGNEYFDVGAKFHVPDNTPYIRYFLSSFLQHQLFESLCKAAVFGRRGVTYDLPKSIALHRCDIYGSKVAGKILKNIMSRGHSQNWQKILIATIDEDNISAAALLKYYEPLKEILTKIVNDLEIPIGW